MPYKRIIGRCTVAGEDLGEWMVTQGWAVAYYLYSYEYSRAEHRAKSARRGIWVSEFLKPWEWRRRQKTKATDAATSSECRLKGAINPEPVQASLMDHNQTVRPPHTRLALRL